MLLDDVRIIFLSGAPYCFVPPPRGLCGLSRSRGSTRPCTVLPFFPAFKQTSSSLQGQGCQRCTGRIQQYAASTCKNLSGVCALDFVFVAVLIDSAAFAPCSAVTHEQLVAHRSLYVFSTPENRQLAPSKSLFVAKSLYIPPLFWFWLLLILFFSEPSAGLDFLLLLFASQAVCVWLSS